MVPNKKILITIDVEDWFQVENMRQWIPPANWDSLNLRVEHNTNRLLNLFDRLSSERENQNRLAFSEDSQSHAAPQHHIKVTFFILGWVAERLPGLVKEICRRGHEVASHGYGHLMCNHLDSIELKEDLKRSKALLEDLAGREIKGYRAPSFSVDNTVLESIRQCGYAYDSSYNNFGGHDRYGKLSTSGWLKRGIALKTKQGFYEIPISNLGFANQTIPWGGGGYFRLIPPSVFMAGVSRILKSSDAYMFYLHPWEIDASQPKVSEAKGFGKWRHYLNLHKTHDRLKRLIKRFNHCRFMNCSEYIEDLKLKSNLTT